jgi:hypothetical protein
MTTRQELLDQWQQRLADAELACEATVVPAWSDRLRVKLYRFLLAMYGQTDWPGPQNDVDNSQERAANAQLTVAEPKEEFAGKQPRSRAEILQGLRNVKGLGEELAPAGPLTDGLLPNSPFVVAACRKNIEAVRISRQLRRHGFMPKIGNNGGLYQVFVTAEYAPAALLIVQDLAEARAEALSRTKGERPLRRQTEHLHPLVHVSFWCTLAAGVLGLYYVTSLLVGLWLQATGVTALDRPPDVTKATGAAIFFTFLAVALGLVWALLRQRYSGGPNR